VKVRFQSDNDLDYRLVHATRQLDASLDFRSALEAQLHGKEDTAVLKIAAEKWKNCRVARPKNNAGEFRRVHPSPILNGINHHF
jgi:hypothetical protein